MLSLLAVAFGWWSERNRAGELQLEIDRLNQHLGPDYFAHMYHVDPERSAMLTDPLDSVDKQTKELYQSLLRQSDAWTTGLVQYLGLDRVRGDLDPMITRQVWWRGELSDDDGKRFYVYLADRERQFATLYASAFIVTDAENNLVAWHGTDIDGPKVLSIEMTGETFPAKIKYIEGSRQNGDAGHFTGVITKTSLKSRL